MSPHPLTPIRLRPDDAARYVRLRARMLHDSPWAFNASPGDDAALDVAHVARLLARDDAALLAVEAPDAAAIDPVGARPALVAVAGLTRGRPPKFAHRAKIWGVFVEPAYRARGLGRRVVGAAVDLARAWAGVDYVDLSVSANSPEAARLYERLGFVAWGREPETLEHAGRRYDEVYMALRLARGATP